MRLCSRRVSGVGKVRVAAFTILATVILLGPTYGHFFAKGRLEHLGWRMYRVRALDFCAVDYRRHLADGSEEPIDRLAVLGYTDPDAVPYEVWHVGSPESAREQGRQLCGRIGAGADVRVVLRCATVDGWRTDDDGTHDLCGGAP